MNKLLLVLTMLLCFILQWNSGQINNKLERYIDRPLTLHKNNFEFAFAYQFGVLSSVFDDKIKRLDLEDAGIAASNQKLNFQFSYGISERLQLQALFGYYYYKKTSNEIFTMGLGNYLTSETYGITTSIGYFDPSIRLNFLVLPNEDVLSLSIGGEISLPLSKYKPGNPDIDTISSTAGTSNFPAYQFVYTYHNGTGVPTYNINLAFKYRLDEVASNNLIFRLFTDYYFAPSVISTNDWHYVFNADKPNGYSLQSLPVERQQGIWLNNRFYADYQAFNITSFMVGMSNRIYIGGWEQKGYFKTNERNATEFSISLGAHIQASPKLRIDQALSFPVLGLNMESYFTCQIALIYKLM